MLTEDLTFLLIWEVPWIVVVLAFGWAAFRAFNLSRAITVRLRKRQVLGLGLVALAMAWVSANFVLNHPFPGTGLAGDAYFLLQFFLPALIYFYWIDSSVLVTRRSDPFLRDFLHWSRIRIGVWAYLLFMTLAYGVVILFYYDLILENPAGPSPILGIALASPIFVPFVTGPILLPMIARRSRDPAIRAHLKWFALFAASLGASIPLGIGMGNFLLQGVTTLWQAGWVVAAYCLFRSAGSLVILNRPPTDAREIDETSSPVSSS